MKKKLQKKMDNYLLMPTNHDTGEKKEDSEGDEAEREEDKKEKAEDQTTLKGPALTKEDFVAAFVITVSPSIRPSHHHRVVSQASQTRTLDTGKIITIDKVIKETRKSQHTT